jgi:hypothetical protein
MPPVTTAKLPPTTVLAGFREILGRTQCAGHLNKRVDEARHVDAESFLRNRLEARLHFFCVETDMSIGQYFNLWVCR